ncbi:MAG: HTTM domain-containing protein, partial [Flavobacteriaceae bacterium]|nr:HTTM domain-containing protein [Flavobacteriaceae bacterium]
AIAKIYPGWLDLDAIATFMAGKRHYVLVGEFLQEKALHYFLAFGGLFFDLLVAIGLLYKPTRKFAFGCAVFFHLFNSVIFQVGIFPFLGLAFCLFFFDTETIRKIFLKKKSAYTASEVIVPQYKNFLLVVGIVYFAFQIGMPLRHWVIPGDVLYTEEGHRMSWRMMLRAKASTIQFKVEKEDGTAFLVKPNELLSSKQARVLGGRPDMIWQFAQYLAQREAEKGA